jgi:predicted DNA-binding transcriptional regulator YafY
MAKSNNQKAKILFLEHMLRETGENRTVSMQKILDTLQENGITAERKSVYDDLEALRVFGMDVRFRRGRPGGYYLAGNTAPQLTVSEDGEAETAEAAEVSREEVTADEPLANEKGVRFACRPSKSDKKMKLICASAREPEIQEYFGEYAQYSEREDGTLLVVAPLLNDPQFYGWLTSMGTDVRLFKPRKAGQAYREYLKSLAKEYKGL